MSTWAGDEPCSVWSEQTRRARKERRCDACRERILPGSLYSYTFYVHDGNTGRITRCARCEVLYRELCRLHRTHEGEIEFDGDTVDTTLHCGHTFEQVFKREPPLELARLAFMTRAEAEAALVLQKESRESA